MKGSLIKNYWLYHWLNVNRLSLKISKTNFVIFHPFNKPMKNYITLNKINKMDIGGEKYVKCLGLLIDARPFITPNILKKNIYYSLVYPHLLYGIQVWGSAFDTNINKLIVLQKKTVRMMTFNENPIGS